MLQLLANGPLEARESADRAVQQLLGQDGAGEISGLPKRTHLHVTPPITTRRTALVVTKLDYEDASPCPVLRNLQQLDDADKPGAPGKFGRYIGEGNLEDLCDHDLARRQLIPASDLHVWPLPKTNGGGDLTATNAVAEASKELHVLSPNAKGRAATTCGSARGIDARNSS